MRKILTIFITVCLAVAMATEAMADQQEKVDVYEQNKLFKSVVFAVGQNQYFVDGKTPGTKMDAAPYIAQSRTFVPVRYLANALGVTDEKIGFENNMVALNTEKVVAKMFIGQKKIVANDISIPIDVAPELKAGRTYLPARFVAEALGYQVDFIDGLVVCYPVGSEKPDVSAIEEYVNGKQPQPQNPTPTQDTYLLNGYTVPKQLKTEIRISDNKEKRVEMKIGIIVPNSDIAKQCDEAEQILASKFGAEFAKELVNYAQQKTHYRQEIYSDFTGPNGESIEVSSPWGAEIISIVVWSNKGGVK